MVNMDAKKLLEVRARIKRKKPLFGRKDSNKKRRIEPDVWRKARGCDNKQRLKRKGHKKSPKQGFRSPLEIRGFHRIGLKTVLVSNIKQLHAAGKEAGVIISSSLGDRKRKLLLEEAVKKGIPILNLNPAKAIEQINARMNERQQMKKKSEEEHKKAKEKEKKEHKHEHKETAEKKEEELSDEEKKKLEKEEKDKVLTAKQ
jgi:large subunit ribosomal protein L32e